MKSILIVTEQFTMGGLETHIRGEILRLTEKGVKVHLATGRAFDDALLPDALVSLSHGIPLDPTISPNELLVAIDRLREIIREKSIDCVHVHPFSSIVPAVVAAELEAIPIAITIHGPASLMSYGPLYDLLIKHVILPKSALIIAVSPEVRKLLSAYAEENNVIYIPNAVSFLGSVDSISNSNEVGLHWLVISRLDQFKIQGIADFCEKAKLSGIHGIRIAGDGPAKDELLIDLDRRGLSSYVTLLGASTQVDSLIQRSAGVAGMGRVVLEGLSFKKPVVLVGYDGVKGVVDQVLLQLAAENNFSGRGLPTISSDDLSEQIKKITPSEGSQIYSLAKSLFSDDDSWAVFFNRLTAVKKNKPSVISELYQSLSGIPINGAVPYLHSLEVLDRLDSIIVGSIYFEPKLAAALSFCRHRMNIGQKAAGDDELIISLRQEIAKRDEKIISLNQTLIEREERIINLSRFKSKINKIQNKALNSSTTRITDFMRSARNKVMSIKSLINAFIRIAATQGVGLALLKVKNRLRGSGPRVVACKTLKKDGSPTRVCKTIDIININFFDWDGVVLYKGGAERYVYDLACLLQANGFRARIIQNANRDFAIDFRGVEVLGVKMDNSGDLRTISKKYRGICAESDLIIASPADLACELGGMNVIGINHGIFWDHKFKRLDNANISDYKNIFDAIKSSLLVVAVDTNFINWMRTYDYSLAGKIKYIPNYYDASFYENIIKDFSEKIRVLYPRRLYEARGIFMTMKAFDYLLEHHSEIELHLVGQANDEDGSVVSDFVKRWSGRVIWEEYDMDEMHKVYATSHIVLVPTCYSEGTSLSCIEAMSTNNAIVATNIGGLPNLVIDGFNGYLINPDPSELILAVESLLRDRGMMREMATNGVKMSTVFEKKKWSSKWLKTVLQVLQ